MKVGFVTNDWSREMVDEDGYHFLGGAAEYRCRTPAKGLYRQGRIDVVVGLGASRKDGTMGVAPLNAPGLPVEESAAATVWDCDVIVMQRHMEQTMVVNALRAHAIGQIIVNDVDDLFFALPPSNRAFAMTHPKVSPTSNVGHYERLLAHSDAITTSTPYLAERIVARTSGRVPVHVLRNRIDPYRFADPWPVPRARPVLAWTGATQFRAGDLGVLAGTLHGLLGDPFAERFLHIGDLDGAPSAASQLGLDDEQVRKLPLMPLDTYYKAFDQFDVGVVPLTKHPFNFAKSAIKGIEYAYAGKPFVASPTYEYTELEKQGWGVTAWSPREWRKRLCALVNGDWTAPLDRTDLTIDAHVDEWARLYESLLPAATSPVR